MKVIQAESGVLVVELTRRNLTALLAKLDGHPPGSHRSLAKTGVLVKAVEDLEHYADAAPGEVHEGTLRAMSADQNGADA